MAVDYLSAINQGGSGLNITQIVDSLVDAEKTPQENSIQTKIDAKTTSMQLERLKVRLQLCRQLLLR